MIRKRSFLENTWEGKKIPVLSDDGIAQHIDLLAPTLEDTTPLRLGLRQ